MPIVVGIDGTGGGVNPGAARDRRYDEDFRDSFVRRITRGDHNKRYFRGPVTLGGGLVEAISQAYRFIRDRREAVGTSEPILLTGYSRGAAGVVSLAKDLEDDNINVRAMMLFDCVDRHIAIDADIIPRNVENVYHVIRDSRTASRESFDNDGLRYYPVYTNYPPAVAFMCTHGGMGGTPWRMPVGASPNDFIDEGGTDGMTRVTYAQDARISGDVWRHVQPFLLRHQFIVRTE
jgi:hypothetical protein